MRETYFQRLLFCIAVTPVMFVSIGCQALSATHSETDLYNSLTDNFPKGMEANAAKEKLKKLGAEKIEVTRRDEAKPDLPLVITASSYRSGFLFVSRETARFKLIFDKDERLVSATVKKGAGPS